MSVQLALRVIQMLPVQMLLGAIHAHVTLAIKAMDSYAQVNIPIRAD
jgi:hypothetical protein